MSIPPYDFSNSKPLQNAQCKMQDAVKPPHKNSQPKPSPDKQICKEDPSLRDRVEGLTNFLKDNATFVGESPTLSDKSGKNFAVTSTPVAKENNDPTNENELPSSTEKPNKWWELAHKRQGITSFLTELGAPVRKESVVTFTPPADPDNPTKSLPK